MRDPKRLKAVLSKILTVWKKYPDYRLCQLIVNATSTDPYYYEDDELIEALERYYREVDN